MLEKLGVHHRPALGAESDFQNVCFNDNFLTGNRADSL